MSIVHHLLHAGDLPGIVGLDLHLLLHAGDLPGVLCCSVFNCVVCVIVAFLYLLHELFLVALSCIDLVEVIWSS